MTTHVLNVTETVATSDESNADSRYSFTAQFLMAATMHTRSARDIETKELINVTEDDRMTHRGHVVAAIMQSTASLESEIWEVMAHGPGHHLGSNGIDQSALNFLSPLAELIDRQDVLSRYESVLHLLRKPVISRGAPTWEQAALVVKLRNEIVHYKSKWGSDLERSTFLSTLHQLKHAVPPFIAAGTNFFPHLCLSADCASWAVATCVNFIDAFYDKTGITSPLDAFRSRLTIARVSP